MSSNKRPQAPCKNCPERAPGCHGKCEKYLEFKAADDAFRARNLYDHGLDYFAARTRKALKILQKSGRAPKC